MPIPSNATLAQVNEALAAGTATEDEARELFESRAGRQSASGRNARAWLAKHPEATEVIAGDHDALVKLLAGLLRGATPTPVAVIPPVGPKVVADDTRARIAGEAFRSILKASPAHAMRLAWAAKKAVLAAESDDDAEIIALLHVEDALAK